MRHLFSCLLLLLPFFGAAQKYAFLSYSTEEGLPQTQVTSICQDDDGYLWVGTLGGLAKFNGQEFESFSPNDGILNNRIQTLYYDSDILWIGHDGGISFKENNVIRKIEFTGTEKSRYVSEIIRFKDKIIVCTNGGGLYQVVKNKFVAIQLPSSEDNRFIRAATVSGNYLYLATRAGIIKTTDLRKFVYETGVERGAYFGVEANQDHLYFISREQGIYHKNLKTNQITHTPKREECRFYTGGYIDRQGLLWIYSTESVIIVKGNEVIRVVDNKSGLPVMDAVNCVFDDNEGNFWIGSNGKGMFRFPGEQFKYYDRSTDVQSDLFLTGFETTKGEFYLGTLDIGLVKRLTDGSTRIIDIGHPTIWSSQANVDGFNWFGTQVSMVSLDQNDRVKVYTEADGLPGSKITAFYKVGPREMYIGGNRGISHYKNGVITPINPSSTIEVGTVRDFVELDGAIVFASNLGLFQYKNGVISSYFSIENVTYSLEKDKFGNVWFGTEEGLFRIRGKKIERIELRKNPGSNYINFINHRDGKLYVGSNNGLFLLNNLDLELPKIKRYGLGEGIVNLETNLNSSFFDRKDNFWFGTAAGLVCFNTQAKAVKSGLPNVKIRSILLNYQTFTYANYSKELDKAGLPVHLNLPYSKNNLIFELDGISLSNHRGLNYQFFLEGLDDKWSPLTTNSTITFTNLPAGDYVLRMRSVDIDGRVSKEIVVPFTIRPPFYFTWWFIGLCILGAGGLVMLFFRFRVRRINAANEKERLEFKSRLLSLEQQSMNASMNRHFVFNSLNSIQYFINTRDRVSANKYLTNFAKLIRKNLDTATLDGNMITLDEELERLELYLSLECMRFKDRFDYEINVEGIETESLLIPAMILQPFVENSIIHGILPNLDKKGKIVLDVKLEDGYLLMSVEDNGIGVNHSIHQKGGMEGDHRSKGMEITSKRIDLIQKISNDDISLDGPYEVYNDDRSIKGTRVLLKIPINNLDN
jgi:ligand-binding sensor domain-containing protein/signal transduction histidine kinase